MSQTGSAAHSGRPSRTGTRRRRGALGPTLIVLVAVVLVWWLVSELFTDWLWFKNLDFGQVFTTRWVTGVVLFACGALLTGATSAVNMVIAWRNRPVNAASLESDLLDHYRGAMSRRTKTFIAVPSVLLGVIAGAVATGNIDTTLAFLHRTSFGTKDAHFGMDVSFFVFTMPFLQFVLAALMGALVLGTVLAGLVHFVTGSVHAPTMRLRDELFEPRISRPGRQPLSSPFNGAAQVHLSVMLGLVFVVYGLQRLLSRYEFAVSDNDSLFTGIGYTDAHSRITARLIVAIISFICAAMFFANAKLKMWRLPGTAIILMIVSSLLIQGLYPSFVQQFGVKPNEPDRERPYIADQIAATRKAYDIDDVQVSDYSAKTTVSAGQLKSDAEALPGIRLVDPAIVAPTFEQLQQVRGYYSFPPVLDVDRYTLNGQTTDTIVAAREIDISGLPDQSWNNIHTVYTHGFGLVAAYGNRLQDSGEPEWIEGDIPPTGLLDEKEPRLYFGEQESQYVIAGNVEGATPVELDTPGGSDTGGEQHTTYAGKGGVAIGNPIVRAMYSTKFADLNLLLSGRVNKASRILYDRTPQQRVKQIAPWLTVDQDPYPAVVDGRVVWIVDGYTTTADYPDSQHVNYQDTISDSASDWRTSGDTRQVNYIRNSVKGVVDAYDGTVKLYDWDPSDPIVQTWSKAYPGLLLPKSEISADLLDHLRYPQDIFKVQRQILGRYHMTDPGSWYNQSDLWVVPADPRDKSGKSEPPYYLSIKWPGDSSAVFSQTAVYVPNNRENMGAYMSVVADASSKDYGTLRVLRLSGSEQVPGPNQTYNAIVSDQQVANKLLAFVGQSGNATADALYGNLLTLPMGDGLIYVEPIYTQRKDSSSGGSAAGSYPVLRFVVVRYGTHIGIGTTLQDALDSVFGGDSGADTGTQPPAQAAPGGGSGGNSGDPVARQALSDANAAFAAADEALKKGDLAGYQSQLAIAQSKVNEATKALGG
ncbi:hypothetical protein SAMN05443377_10512 [Propionibacterium cyclohexanicum]|uniref:UPF0182 protein SAMN05443377_10512 n=1 Tax=Propionibacterium cyclohexanicum TaxID=64702 RepID=A0A1H9QY66_9ACTN|nr:UPF0182 family protein [Propionibacterium cyclohexanicum]SER65390.1 hypothetical protein SAMN05443377_10512 [Propionibacterium cyclohexanicum]